MALQDEIRKAYEEWMIRDGSDIEAVCVQKGVPGNFTGGYMYREPEIVSLREKIAELEECNVWHGEPAETVRAEVSYYTDISGMNGQREGHSVFTRQLPKTPIERVAEANGIDPAVLAKAVKELAEAGK